MAKYQDRFSAGKSVICPFVKGESSSERHLRRLQFNLDKSVEILKLCKESGIACVITNEGQHWQFKKAIQTFNKIPIKSIRQIDWWPSTAKLVYDKNWKAGKHVHDYQQVLNIIQKSFHVKIQKP